MLVILTQLVTLSYVSTAAPGDFNATFAQRLSVDDGPVFAIAEQSGGRILIGGYFSNINRNHRSSFARISADGSLDSGFHLQELGGHLHPVLVLPDDRIVMGGEFSNVNGYTRIDLARLFSNGSLDTSFDVGAGPGTNSNAHVDSLAVQSDGLLIVAGDFENFAGVSYAGIVRLFANGKVDRSFNPGEGLRGHLGALVVDDQDRLIVGGNFTRAGGETRYGITRLTGNGRDDESFAIGAGALRDGVGGVVNALALQSDGKVVVGGNFTWIAGQSRNGIARLNSDGTPDAQFDPGSGIQGPGGAAVESIVIQNDGKIVLAGLFTAVNGAPRGGLARLNVDGTLDSTFTVDGVWNDRIKVVRELTDGSLMLGGYFTDYAGNPAGRLARVESDHKPTTSIVPSLRIAHGEAEAFSLELTAEAGCSLTVQFSSDLYAWRTFTNIVSSAWTTSVVVSGDARQSMQFFRVSQRQ